MKISGLVSTVALATMSISTAGATILTFDNISFLNDTPLTSYGSNVSGLCISSGQPGCFGQGNGFTPNITVSYATNGGGQVVPDMLFENVVGPGGYGDLVNVAVPDAPGNLTGFGEITFTPLNGATVRINSFDAAHRFNFPEGFNELLQILDGSSNVLFSFQGPIDGFNAATHDHFMPSVSSTRPLRLRMINLDGRNVVALDNISFDEVGSSAVPEPATCPLYALGLLLVASLRRFSSGDRRLAAALPNSDTADRPGRE